MEISDANQCPCLPPSNSDRVLPLPVGVLQLPADGSLEDGQCLAQPPDVLAHLVLSVTMEAALLIASGTDRATVEPALLTMLSGLLST